MYACEITKGRPSVLGVHGHSNHTPGAMKRPGIGQNTPCTLSYSSISVGLRVVYTLKGCDLLIHM